MNKTYQKGRLTGDPEVIYANTANGQTAIAKFNIAVDRKFKRDNQPTADFHQCVAFGKTAEFIEKYFFKGSEILMEGSVQNNNYEDKNGVKHYGYNIVVENVEFCGKKSDQTTEKKTEPQPAAGDDFMAIPDGLEDELPFA